MGMLRTKSPELSPNGVAWVPAAYTPSHPAPPTGMTAEQWRQECYIADVVLNWEDPAPVSARVRDVIDVRRPIDAVGSYTRKGFVYFIAAEDGPIKIGFTAELKARLSKLGTGSSRPLRILAHVAGTPSDERGYHLKFSRHRVKGEWFERCPEILAEIARLTPVPEDEVI